MLIDEVSIELIQVGVLLGQLLELTLVEVALRLELLLLELHVAVLVLQALHLAGVFPDEGSLIRVIVLGLHRIVLGFASDLVLVEDSSGRLPLYSGHLFKKDF